MRSRAFVICVVLLWSESAPLALGAVEAFMKEGSTGAQSVSTAVDSRGVRHRASDYPGKTMPWLTDVVRRVAPDYPFGERFWHRQGSGLFRLALDLKTGAVTKVTIMRSTGFKRLDESAVTALGQWRWQQGKWQEVVVPVTFTIVGQIPTRLPPGAKRIPKAGET